jgi:hypothetical protein
MGKTFGGLMGCGKRWRYRKDTELLFVMKHGKEEG